MARRSMYAKLFPWYFGYRKQSSRIFFEVIIVGKNPPINTTPEDDRNFIRGHIQSFPAVSSHYTLKDSNPLYLNPDLLIKNMHQLYEEEYHKKRKKLCNVNAYTDIFCEELNLAIHKPQKDQCPSCTMYYEKKQRGETTDEDERQFEEPRRNKETAREEKKKEKERAKSDKSFAAVTFDLEAVLPTPCTMDGDLFY
jgi:hypothetical protein